MSSCIATGWEGECVGSNFHWKTMQPKKEKAMATVRQLSDIDSGLRA
ncbi:hypothetical protein SAMN05216212_3153 [Microbulbifer yueqingensis]|uniref:Uncharacterized protein n=1 Tax=Microbulbifer yueqingensis TaxID=658219 RepID=A0A1G9EJH0_9GAMM|nr:hypothetical protein SAMN05216212_3153 [Microbulbifer yueqingensis]